MAFPANWPRDDVTGKLLSKATILELGLPMPEWIVEPNKPKASATPPLRKPVKRVGEVPGVDGSVFSEGFPKRLWNLDYPGETVADRRGFGPKEDPATATEYQFIDGVLTVFTQDEYDAVTAICGPRVVEEDLPESADAFVCDHCGKATRSSKWFKKHSQRHI